MSELSFLINKYCPKGVPFLSLWQLLYFDKRFNGVDKNKQPKTLDFKHVSAEILKKLKCDGDVKLLATGKFDGYTKKDIAKEYINYGEVVTIPSGGTANIKYYNGFFVDGGNILCSSRDSEKFNLRFVYYCLLKENDFIQSCFRGGSVQHPDMIKIIELKIPVPPIEVQCEIVRILDSFTELTAELTARKIQYQTYLDQLFESCDGEEKTLNEIGTLTRGKRFVHADAVENDGIPCIHYGELYTYYGVFASKAKSQIRKSILDEKKLRYAYEGDVIIVGAGENNEDIGVGVSWEGKYPVAVHDACYTFVTDQNPRFISFFLRSSSYHKQIKSHVSEGKICAISADGIGKAKLKLPSLKKQKEAVHILEQFYLLINDISNGLPAEIEARQKQYEYYRDKLLTFKELKA